MFFIVLIFIFGIIHFYTPVFKTAISITNVSHKKREPVIITGKGVFLYRITTFIFKSPSLSVNFCNKNALFSKVFKKSADIYKCIIIQVKDIFMATWKKQNTYVPPIQYKKFNAGQIEEDYKNLYPELNTEREKKNERLESFKQRLIQFKGIKTLQEAKELLNRTMPIALDRSTFYIGEAKVVIVNYDKRLRISLDSPKEYICYDFV